MNFIAYWIFILVIIPYSDAFRCEDHLAGCAVCAEQTAATYLRNETYTCQGCDAGLYLYKYLNPVSQVFTGICVPDCSAADFETVNDPTRGQCLYLGPYCQTYGFATEGDFNQFPTCTSSLFDGKGYVLGQRSEILYWLLGDYNSTQFNTTTTYA